MATVEELLGLEASNVLTVDNRLRTITIPETVKNLGVMSDDDVLRLDFQLPRYCGEFDLSEFDIRINYLNANREGDVYIVTDAAFDDEFITFSWLVGRFAAAFKGNVTFNICLKEIDENNIVTKEFNTTPAILPVLEGLETTEAIQQQYPDLLEAWKAEIFGQVDGMVAGYVNSLVAITNEEIDEILDGLDATLGIVPDTGATVSFITTDQIDALFDN